MKKLLLLLMTLPIFGWAISKPMESIENYNVLMVHGAYGHEKGFLDEKGTNEAYYAGTDISCRWLKKLSLSYVTEL